VASDSKVEVYRSGTLYLVTRDGRAQIVPIDDDDEMSDPLDLQSVLAHCHVSEPWTEVAPDAIPDVVRPVVERFSGR
jgi:hypothetical protein